MKKTSKSEMQGREVLHHLWTHINKIADLRNHGIEWEDIGAWLFPDPADEWWRGQTEDLCRRVVSILDMQQRLSINLGLGDPPPLEDEEEDAHPPPVARRPAKRKKKSAAPEETTVATTGPVPPAKKTLH
ncbi:MAG: hypothetical protein ACYDBH_23795 [Acidobacteriaceae bacterium]